MLRLEQQSEVEVIIQVRTGEEKGLQGIRGRVHHLEGSYLSGLIVYYFICGLGIKPVVNRPRLIVVIMVGVHVLIVFRLIDVPSLIAD